MTKEEFMKEALDGRFPIREQRMRAHDLLDHLNFWSGKNPDFVSVIVFLMRTLKRFHEMQFNEADNVEKNLTLLPSYVNRVEKPLSDEAC